MAADSSSLTRIGLPTVGSPEMGHTGTPSRIAVVLRLLVCGLTLLLLTACGSSDDQPTSAESPARPSPTSDDSDISSPPCLDTAGGTPNDLGSHDPMTKQYLGLTEQEAEALAADQDHTIRVAARDGECFALTMDYREDRVNIYLEDDSVVAATQG